MIALRCILVAIAAVILLGWIGLALVANHFRRSFGASGLSAAKAVLPPIILMLVLFSVIFSEFRPVLHATAAVMGLCAAGSICLLKDSPLTGGFGLVYAVLWSWYYWNTAWT